MVQVPAFYLYPGHTIPGRHFQIVLPYAGESPGYGNTIPIRHSKRIKFKSRSKLSVFSQKNNFFFKKTKITTYCVSGFPSPHHRNSRALPQSEGDGKGTRCGKSPDGGA